MPEAAFSPLACRVLKVLAGEPQLGWVLSGQAALRDLPGLPDTINQLDLAWHGRARLRSLPRLVRKTLNGAGLEAVRLGGIPQRAWIGIREENRDCLVRLVTHPGPLLEPLRREVPPGVSLAVETVREVFAATLCLLEERPEVQDLESLRLLLANGNSLDRGFLDVPLLNPDFCTLNLTWKLAAMQPETTELESFIKDLIASILVRSIPDFRAS